jgi:aspartate aminotransferase
MPDSLPGGVTEGAVDVRHVLDGAPPVRLSAYADAIQGSTILQIAGEIREMIARGDAVLNLTVGDFRPDQFPIPEPLRQRIIAALRDGQTNYPPVAGVTELREAVRERFREDMGLEYPLEGILVAGGARPLIYASFMATVDPGDLVLYPVPSWNNHHYVRLSGARGAALAVRAEKNFHIDRTDLEPHLAEARLLILNSPLNPTGTCIGRDALEGVARAIVEENERRAGTDRRPLFLVYDQVYSSLTFEGVRHFTPVELVPEVAPYTVLVDAVSKGLSGTGLRVGWGAAPPALAAKMKAMAGHFGAWAPRPEQVGTAGFLRDGAALAAHRRHIRAELFARLHALHEGFSAMRADGLPVETIEPQGAIYLSVRFGLTGRSVAGRAIASGEDLRVALLQEAGFGVVPFEAFGFSGEAGWVRLSVGAVSLREIEDGLARVRRMLEAASG